MVSGMTNAHGQIDTAFSKVKPLAGKMHIKREFRPTSGQRQQKRHNAFLTEQRRSGNRQTANGRQGMSGKSMLDTGVLSSEFAWRVLQAASTLPSLIPPCQPSVSSFLPG